MARPQPEKKREGKKPPATAQTTRALPMQPKIGDRITDESGAREVIGRP